MKTLIVASESCAGRFPQNTLPGFQYCLQQAVDGIEFDVHLSQDGHVVVQHDYVLNRRITREPSGRWLGETARFNDKIALCDLSLAEIRRFDVGRYQPESREAKTYPGYQPIDNTPIPTLEEFLQAYIAAGSDAALWIELKTTPFERDISADPDKLLHAVLDLVERYGVVSNTILLAFEWQLLIDAQKACPGIGTDFLTFDPDLIQRMHRGREAIDPLLMYQPLDAVFETGSLTRNISHAGGNWWGPYVGDVEAHDIRAAHALGLKVNVWGVESNIEAIDQALALEADALTISDSTLLQDYLRTG